MSAVTRDLVLNWLRKQAKVAVNANELSRKLGLSPAQLHESIESLRLLGFNILHVDRSGQQGYLLYSEPDRPLAEAIQALLPPGSSIGQKLVFRESCQSTNDLAKAEGESGAPHGTVVVARRQTGGRGRRGRQWLSLPGEHLYVSVVVRTDLPLERMSELTLLTGVALVEAFESCGVVSRLKWPNDVEVKDRKVAGILAELVTDGASETAFVVVGVGVNVDSRAEAFPDEIKARATCLSTHADRRITVAQVAVAFFERLDDWLVLHRSMGLGVVLDAWKMRSGMLGQQVRAVVDGRGVEGDAEDLDETGALLIRDETGKRHRIVAGEVTRLRRADSL